jgi:hypothetical protein
MKAFLRTRLAVVLLAWMALSLIVTLGWGRLSELSPWLLAPVLLSVVVLPALPLLIWSFWAAARRPRSLWPAPVLVVVFGVVFVLAFERLMLAGAYLNFLSHRDAYRSIVADYKGGRLPPASPGRLVEGRKHGVKYTLGSVNTSVIDVLFDWGNNYGFSGVIYSETSCPTAQAVEREPPKPVSYEPGAAEPPTMKNAGRIGGPWWRLEGHYCFVIIQM